MSRGRKEEEGRGGDKEIENKQEMIKTFSNSHTLYKYHVSQNYKNGKNNLLKSF